MQYEFLKKEDEIGSNALKKVEKGKLSERIGRKVMCLTHL